MNNDVTYIKCCVLANGITDTSDDVLIRQEIKRIKTNTKNLNFDIGHNNHYLHGIEIVETYINQSDEYINKTLIPSGSWIMVLAIYNQTIRDMINKGTITGVSLRTELGENVILYDPPTPGERVPYNNIQNKDEMQPSSISFTDDPANMMPIEVMTYEVYTAKDNTKNKKINKHYGDNMEKQNINESEVSFWRSLFKNGLFTAKDVNPQPQPVNGVLDGVNMDEFMQTLIDSQKTIPQQNELLQKIVENQQKQTEAIIQYSSQLEQFKLDLAEFKQDITAKVDEGIVAQKEKSIENTNDSAGDDEKDTSSSQEKNQKDEEDEKQGKTEKESDNQETSSNNPEDNDNQPNEEDEKESDKTQQKGYTAKTSKPFTTISDVNPQAELVNIVRSYSYENLMKQN